MNPLDFAVRDRDEVWAGVRAVAAHAAQGAVERDRTGQLAHHVFADIRQHAFTRLRIPAEHGGFGGTIRDVIAVAIELACADPSITQALRAHYAFIETLREPTVPDTERQRWLQVLADGQLVSNAISERGTERPKDITTAVTAVGGKLVLNGTKFYTTGSAFADLLTVLALDEHGEPATYLIPTARAGVEIIDDWDGMGQRTSASGTTNFVDVPVHSADKLHTDTAVGSFGLSTSSSFRQLYLAAIIAGIARNALGDVVELIRSSGGRVAQYSLTDHRRDDPYVQDEVGRIAGLTYAASTTVLAAATALDHAIDKATIAAAAVEVAQAQVIASSAVHEIGTAIFETSGASGTSAARSLDRHWRNARTLSTHNPLSYKRKAIGNYLINEAEPPGNGYF